MLELTEPPKEPKETYYYGGHIFHKVISQDTLQGLVLRYEAKVDQIKKKIIKYLVKIFGARNG